MVCPSRTVRTLTFSKMRQKPPKGFEMRSEGGVIWWLGKILDLREVGVGAKTQVGGWGGSGGLLERPPQPGPAVAGHERDGLGPAWPWAHP